MRRRKELLSALENMANYARHTGVQVIIVAGDLFDGSALASTVRNVADIVKGSGCTWFVLRGNHGDSSPYDLLANLCSQEVKFFGDDWTKYECADVTICGRELGHDDADKWNELQLDPSRFNVVVLHGDVDDPAYGLIDKKAIARSGASYVALGHRHAYAEYMFGKVRACYSGALEPRGFDECAQTGFVEIDTEKRTVGFVPQSVRSVVTIELDISSVTGDISLERKILDGVADVDTRNYLNLILVGETQESLHVQAAANSVLGGKFFALRVKDCTRPAIDTEALKREVSLRGEFVKLTEDIQDEQLRADVLKMGLAVLGGEDPQ